MQKHYKYAYNHAKLELIKAGLNVFGNEMKRSGIQLDLKNQLISGQSGREGVDFIIKTNTGKYHELFLQPINLEVESSVKILKQALGVPKENLWVALVLFMKEMEPVLYLIPSIQLSQSDDFIFIDNEQEERFKHFSNWEIKIFKKGIKKLSQFAFPNTEFELK